jgi:alpha-beta hydrolase superfamily lysophospholipase
MAVAACTLGVLGAGTAGASAAKPRTTVPGLGHVRLGPGGVAFYHPPKPLPRGGHGSVIWARPIRSPKGARAYRVLYLSKLHDGTRAAVSGFVVAPKGKAPKGGRPVLAWAHGTEGLADNCAPSRVANPAQDLVDYFTYPSPYQQDTGVPELGKFIRAGYVITATDYAGLGTPGVPQYVVARSETRNVFDSVLAARHLKTVHAGRRVVALGWSQGGGAALFMGEQSRYVPKLKFLGSAALAPAADIGPQLANKVPAGPRTPTSPAHGAAIELNLFAGFAAAYPELDATDLVSPAGAQALRGAYRQCINHFAYVINTNVTEPATLFSPAVLNPPAPWQQRANENTAGNRAGIAPILVMQGEADTVINPNSTAQYVQRACRFPEPVTSTFYPGQTHQTIPGKAAPEYVPWIADRFAGKPAPSNC